MSTIDRDYLVNAIAEKWTEYADISDLERFYFDAQSSYLSELTDDELIGFAKDVNINIESE